ncbi:hypothetical protein HY640_00135 [Candidatus Woesearchaeota archaeon]|nr:hypothetical protein [Candidatus Woesearchaeota archaeon]
MQRVRNHYRFVLFALAGLAVVAATKPVMFLLAVFVLLAALSTLYKTFINVGIDLELQSFFTIAAGYAFGSKAGMFVGFLSVLLAHMLNFMFFRNPILSLIYAVSFAGLGALASISGNHVVIAGTMYVLAVDVAFIFLGTALGAPAIRLVIAAITHPFFVYLVLSTGLMPLVRLFG